MAGSSLLIIGAGSFGRTVYEAAMMSGDWQIIDFLDDSYPSHTGPVQFKVIGKTDSFASFSSQYDGVVVAIGNNRIRKDKIESVLLSGANLVNIFHPKAFVSPLAKVGRGALVMAGAVVGAFATIGVGCILNPNAVADHDTAMGDYSHLGVGAVMAGTSLLGVGAWVLPGAALSYGESVADWVTLAPPTCLTL
ncbi:pilin glycosylation protein [Shewanella amazonensis]|uniref:Pilin glycosylation protein n=1 Tax=Shewanella amazonensis (strain ATCC BAA-1098 / SB2B) TaxID=326297 RepID=A1S7U4_SHEAM|nr:pilin glycosylation protein [Shewanella amazonensis]ABM00451.1 pilin glycosylation protein [Shewanella amazonensis SB2B]